jgi:hypothetical protein
MGKLLKIENFLFFFSLLNLEHLINEMKNELEIITSGNEKYRKNAMFKIKI